jgi:hypothetical protein
MAAIVLMHDYGYKLDKSSQWSDFSSLDNADAVQANLEQGLTIGKSTRPDVLSFLAQKGVGDCSILYDEVSCWTPAHETIINTENPLDIRAYNLLVKWDYQLTFRFNNDVLSYIEVSKVGTGP